MLGSGVSVALSGRKRRVLVDWDGVKSLCEAGVSVKEVAELFRIPRSSIWSRARSENWLMPANIDRARRELNAKIIQQQRDGQPINLVKARAAVWEDRSERVREQAFKIADDALTAAVKGKKGRKLIRDSKDLVNVTKVAREATGLEAKEAAAATPKMAVNLHFLRSAPQPVIDV